MYKRNGFTLIELLVVISIIALLIGLLLPALSAAKRSAINAKCLTNLKSMAIASHAYGMDNEGHFLPGDSRYSLQVVGVGIADTVSRKHWVGYLDNYSIEDGSESLYCPMNDTDTLHSFGNGWPNTELYSTELYAIGYSNFVRINGSGLHSDNRARGRHPSTAALTPSDMPIFSDIVERKNATEWLYYSHSETGAIGGNGESNSTIPPGGMNSAFADGSVSWTAYEDGTDEMEAISGGGAAQGFGFLWAYKSKWRVKTGGGR